jgi:hypothetical protein
MSCRYKGICQTLGIRAIRRKRANAAEVWQLE